jgi:hypothetical protein
MNSYAIGKSFLLRGKKVKAMAETDSGNVKVAHANGTEEWTFFGSLCPIDGQTKGFKVFALPIFEDNAKLAA